MIKEQKHASQLMPKSEEAQLILKARAIQLAKQEIDTRKNNGIAFIRFGLKSHERYGAPYQYVQDILTNALIAKPPFIPNFIAGIINWRGSLITIVDLDKFFHPNDSEHDNRFIIVVNANNITLGLLINRVEDSENYQPDQLSVPLSSVNIAKPEFILGLHQSITAILDVEVLLSGLSQEIKKNLYRIGDVYGNC